MFKLEKKTRVNIINPSPAPEIIPGRILSDNFPATGDAKHWTSDTGRIISAEWNES